MALMKASIPFVKVIFVIFAAVLTSFDLTDAVPPKPENISCVLYAKRILTCNYDLRDDAKRNLTTCTICSQSTEEQTLNDTCPDNISSLACNTSAGKCVYNCDSLTFCDDYHMINITLTGSDATLGVSMCRQIRTKEYIQPGPVRDLRVTAINSTALQVAWKKPYDRYRYYDKYAYTVRYMDTVKHIKKLRTKEEDIEIVLSDLLPWRNYNVTVRARPRNKGFRSLPQTVSTLDDKNQTWSPDAQREPEKSVVATVVLTFVFSAMPAVLIAGVAVLIKERVRCDRIPITLPKMMPLSVYKENDRSFVRQESRRRRNEAELSGLKDGVNGICEEDPICGRCPDTNVALEGEMQPRDCTENSVEKNVKSASCLQENEVETSQENPEENEHVETWSCSTYTGMSAYSYKQVTLSNDCPWTVDKS